MLTAYDSPCADNPDHDYVDNLILDVYIRSYSIVEVLVYYTVDVILWPVYGRLHIKQSQLAEATEYNLSPLLGSVISLD